MLTSWRSALVLICCLAISAWIVGDSKTFKSCVQEHHQNSAQKDAVEGAAKFLSAIRMAKDCTGHFVEENGEGVIASFTIILAISTIGLWLATNRLWAAGERQIELARESSVAQSRDMQDSIAVAKRSADVAENSIVQLQRALIVLTNFSIDTIIRGQSVIGFQISAMFENTGNTIAKRYTGNANIVMWQGDLPPTFPFADRQSSGSANGFVGPRVKVPFPIGIAIQDVIDIQKKKRRGFMYGWVEYEDIFEAGRKRRTEFCVELEVIGDPLIRGEKASIFGFGGYGKYNGTDEDCLYKPGERPPIGGLPEPTQPPPESPTIL